MTSAAEIRAQRESQIATAQTGAGGWTKDTLTHWGVSWPPPKGWKESLIENGFPEAKAAVPYRTKWQKLLAGEFGYTVMPLTNSEVAHFYWCTDIKTTEIQSAFQDYEIGEAEVVGALCSDCRRSLTVKSRYEAEQWMPNLQAGRSQLYAKCKPCRRRFLDERDAPFHEEMRKRKTRQRELRFMPYADYLKTQEWQETRKAALKRAGFKCQTCSAGGELHVHHRTYIRRGAERNSDLIVLCADCHQLFHDNGKLAENGRAA